MLAAGDVAAAAQRLDQALLGDDITGISVHIAARVAALAQPAEILVSRTVKDLVVGSAISFTTRGTHRLTEIPDRWPLFAVTSA